MKRNTCYITSSKCFGEHYSMPNDLERKYDTVDVMPHCEVTRTKQEKKMYNYKLCKNIACLYSASTLT